MLEILLGVGFWTATVRIATILIFGTLGALMCEKSGVLNLGIEGIMTMGALSGWMWVYAGGGLWGAVLFAFFIGGLWGAIHSGLTVYLGVSQHVSGIGITLLASSLSYYSFRLLLPESTTPPKIIPFKAYNVPILSDIPWLGEIFFQQTPLTYLAFFAVLFVWYLLYKTPLGLSIRAVGESPFAAESQGINVFRIRNLCVIFGSGLMSVGGSFLTISAFDAFYFGMINGRGWICIALVIFASWKPGKALLGAILFAGFEAFQVRAQLSSLAQIPHQFFLMLPYIMSILALIVISKNVSYPKALLTPFRKGER